MRTQLHELLEGHGGEDVWILGGVEVFVVPEGLFEGGAQLLHVAALGRAEVLPVARVSSTSVAHTHEEQEQREGPVGE